MKGNGKYSEKEIASRFGAAFKTYSEGKTRMIDPPKPLFGADGRFDPDNWNSGQDIRAILHEAGEHVYDSRLDAPFEAWIELDENADCDDCGIFWSGEKKDRDEQRYIMISIVKNAGFGIACDSYLISWYKTRGRTNAMLKNGNPMTLGDYAELLGLLDKAGFFGPGPRK